MYCVYVICMPEILETSQNNLDKLGTYIGQSQMKTN